MGKFYGRCATRTGLIESVTPPMTILVLLALCQPAAAAQSLRPAFSPSLKALGAEAMKDPAAATSREAAKTGAAAGFTGENPLPFHVKVLSPVELIDPAAPPSPRPPQPQPAPGDKTPTYHFEGKKPMGGLTIYTPVRDQEGQDNSTRASGGGGGLFGLLKGLVKWAAVIGGAALMIWGGPVGLVAGAALVAAGATLFLKKN